MYIYKKLSDKIHHLVGVVQAKTGEVIKSVDPIEHPDFEQVKEAQSIVATEVAQPAVVINAAPVVAVEQPPVVQVETNPVNTGVN